jgi:hypothetical protein
MREKNRPDPSAGGGREILVLHDHLSSIPDVLGIAPLSWKDAGSGSLWRLAEYRHLICFPVYVGAVGEALLSKLRECLAQGAHILFMIHAGTTWPMAAEPLQNWQRVEDLTPGLHIAPTRYLLNRFLGVDVLNVESEERGPGQPLVASLADPLRAHMAQHPCHFTVIDRLEVSTGVVVPRTFTALWGWGRTHTEPGAACGVFGSGEWAVLPWGARDPERHDVERLTVLLDHLDGWATRSASEAAYRVAPESLVERGGDASQGQKDVRRSVSASGDTGLPPSEGAKSLSKGDDEALYSPAQLAEKFRLPVDATEKRLERWRREVGGGKGFVENPDRGPNDPKYVYQLGAVRPFLLKPLRKSSRHSSHGRPADPDAKS